MKKFSSLSRKTKGIISLSLVLALVMTICFGTSVLSARPDEELGIDNLMAPKDPTIESSTEGLSWKPLQDSTDDGAIAQQQFFLVHTEDAKQGSKSLKILPGANTRLWLNPVFKSNTWYEISFWAKKSAATGRLTIKPWWKCDNVVYDCTIEVTEASTDWVQYAADFYVTSGYAKLDAWNGYCFEIKMEGGTEGVLVDDIKIREILANTPTPSPTPSPSPTVSPTPEPTPVPTAAPTEKPVVKVKSVKLNKSKITIYVKKSFQLKATVSPKNAVNKKVTWTTSNKKVAKVNKSGKVTGVKAGKAKITAKTKNGKKAVCRVTVKKAKKKKK